MSLTDFSLYIILQMQGSFNVGWPHLSTVFESSAQTVDFICHSLHC